jgi:LuxR family maltose regulon positive regulatory protein
VFDRRCSDALSLPQFDLCWAGEGEGVDVSRNPTAVSQEIPNLIPRFPSFGFEISESRLRPPPARTGTVERHALLTRLDACTAPVIAVVAPPGFGKTTLLTQWAAARTGRIAWLSVDETDNDPQVLVAHMLATIAAIEPIDPRVVNAIEARRPPTTVIARTAAWLEHVDTSLALVVDNVDALHNPESVSVLTQLALTWPFYHRFVVATREAMSWPTGRLRAEGRIVEFGANDLALDAAEACELLDKAGVELSRSETQQLIEHADGWAAGLYLSALAVQAFGVSRAIRP